MMSVCYAIANTNPILAERIFWTMPLSKVWQFLLMQYQKNEIPCRWVHGTKDTTAILREVRKNVAGGQHRFRR